jgi:hypothetical protein
MGYWIINTAGNGGIIVVGIATIVLIAYARMVYWICEGGKVEDDNNAHE